MALPVKLIHPPPKPPPNPPNRESEKVTFCQKYWLLCNISTQLWFLLYFDNPKAQKKINNGK